MRSKPRYFGLEQVQYSLRYRLSAPKLRSDQAQWLLVRSQSGMRQCFGAALPAGSLPDGGWFLF